VAVQRQTGNTLKPLLLASLLILQIQSASALFTAEVNRTEISEVDLVTLDLVLTDPQDDIQPDLRPLSKDFQVIQISPSSAFSIINGRTSSTRSWLVEMRAKRLGPLTIPAIRAGNQTTRPIALNVTNAPTRGNQIVFFETSVDRTQAWVQSQVIYTVKLFWYESINGEFPAAPQLDDAIIETLEEERRSRAVINGRTYSVFERRYAIFPQKSGQMMIPREVFTGLRSRGGRFGNREKVSAVSEQHLIEVKPRSAGFPGSQWLPASSLELEEVWSADPTSLTVGDPLNRTLIIKATGITSSLLPELPRLSSDLVKNYVDPPASTDEITRDGITASRQEVHGILPVKAGTLTLPPVEIHWWDTKAERTRTARIPGRTVNIEPTAATYRPPQPSQPPQTVSNQGGVPETNIWQYVAGAAIAAWLITLILWRLGPRPTAGKEPRTETRATPSPDVLFRDLLTAAKRGDASASHRLLGAWLAQRFAVHSVSDMKDDALTAAATALERAIFSPAPAESWSGEDLQYALDDLNKRDNRKLPPPLLPSLNPA